MVEELLRAAAALRARPISLFSLAPQGTPVINASRIDFAAKMPYAACSPPNEGLASQEIRMMIAAADIFRPRAGITVQLGLLRYRYTRTH